MGDSPSIEGIAFITHALYGSDNTVTSINLGTGSKTTLKLLDSISTEKALALSPSGDIIITAEWNNGISFYDTSTMTTIHRMRFDDSAMYVAWSLDGQYIAAVIASGEVIIINPSTRSIINKVKSHHYAVHAVSFNRTSDKLVSGSVDNTAIIYTVPDLTVLMTLEGHTDSICCSLFLHDDRVVTGSEDHTIRVWDAEGKSINIIKELDEAVNSLAVSPDGKVLVSGYSNGKLYIYDTDTYKMSASISYEGEIDSLCFINNSIVLAGVHASEMIAVDVHNGKVIKKYEGKYACPSIVTRTRPEPPIMVCVYWVLK